MKNILVFIVISISITALLSGCAKQNTMTGRKENSIATQFKTNNIESTNNSDGSSTNTKDITSTTSQSKSSPIDSKTIKKMSDDQLIQAALSSNENVNLTDVENISDNLDQINSLLTTKDPIADIPKK
jgi:hypothetical protein